MEEMVKDPQALKMGGRLSASGCSVCHGSDAKDAFGFPNLADSDWRWGGDAETIETTILGGRMVAMGVPNLIHPAGFIYGTSLTRLEQTIRHGRQGHMPAERTAGQR